jgi:hypothetical protein
MVSFGSSSARSSLQTQEFPGIFGGADRGAPRRIGLNIQDILGQDVGFGGRTGTENELISQLIDLAGANTAVRGLGAPTAESIASSIAPTLLNLRQQRVGERGQRVQGLLELAGLASPQIVAGQQSTARDFGFGIGTQGK